MAFAGASAPHASAETPFGTSATVLALDDGAPMVGALIDRLEKEGVQVETVDLNDPGRPVIDSEFLAEGGAAGSLGRFSGVVLPTDAPAQLAESEREELADYESDFAVRQVSMYDWANPTLGLNYAADPGYMGAVDGMEATLTPEALAGPFGYLQGSVELDDFDPGVAESYGYLATPLASDPNGGTFTPLLTAVIPGTDVVGSLMGVYDQGGRERLIITFASNQYQQHFKVLSHGIVTWLTRGVSTSMNRNYLSIHSDDVFMSDAKWSIEGNCTIADGCDPEEFPPDAPGATVRMQQGDFDRLVEWQQNHGLLIDQVFNGFGSQDYIDDHETDVDPLLEEASSQAQRIRWVNHTWQHEFMGCLQTSNAPPWVCLLDEEGNTAWYPKERVDSEIALGVAFAADNGLPIDSEELVTGEHSGLLTLPQQPEDNPGFIESLGDQGVAWVASDASREKEPRAAGAATTVPRYPMNLYYNVSTEREAASEFNWIYTSRAHGGSGLCEDNPETSTCIAPLDLDTGFTDYIKPLETRMMVGHIVDNDARPHFAHQSNLTDDAIVYPVLSESIEEYALLFAPNAPLVNPSLSEAGQALVAHQEWDSSKAQIDAQILGDQFLVTNQADFPVQTPVTVPSGATLDGEPFGEAYGTQSSAWVSVQPQQTLTFDLTPAAASPTEEQPESEHTDEPVPAESMPEDAPSTVLIEEPSVLTDQIEEAEELAQEVDAAPTQDALQPPTDQTADQTAEQTVGADAPTLESAANEQVRGTNEQLGAKVDRTGQSRTDRGRNLPSSQGRGRYVV